MKCIHDLQDEIDSALDTAFEMYGRAVFFENGAEEVVVGETIHQLLGAFVEVDVYLETAEEESDPASVEGQEE